MRSVKNQVKDSALKETSAAVDENTCVVVSQNYKNCRLSQNTLLYGQQTNSTFRSSHMYFKKKTFKIILPC